LLIADLGSRHRGRCYRTATRQRTSSSKTSLVSIYSRTNGALFSIWAQELPQNAWGFPHAEDSDCGVHPIAGATASRQDPYVGNLILIVDDSPRFRAAAAELLAGWGFELFDVAGDGPQALAAVAGRCPDGILLDVNLPGPDGFAVAASLAAACPVARIVLTSTDADCAPPQAMAASAAVAFVPKQELAVTDLRALFAA
jgi:CheY-like chemotaxis protein